MLLRRTLTFALLALAVPLAGPAQAATKTPAAKVLECRSSESTDSRSATFQGRMKAIPGTDRMLMRFTLMERFGDERLHSVAVPELRTWRSAKTGIRDFRYRQTITALQSGGEYRMSVDFRWLDADGNLLRKARRVSGPCRQQGELANLIVGLPSVLAGPEGTGVYIIPVRNTGRVTAEDVAVELFIDGAASNVGHIDTVAPGETREVRLTGPACKRSLRVVVDPADAIRERLESDNVASARCPSLTG